MPEEIIPPFPFAPPPLSENDPGGFLVDINTHIFSTNQPSQLITAMPDYINNITACIGGGIAFNYEPAIDSSQGGELVGGLFSSGIGIAIELPAYYFNPVTGFLPILSNIGELNRDFTSINDIINLSPIPFNEKVNFNGYDQFNCSLFNRFYQAKTLIVSESTFTYQPGSDGSGTTPPYMFYGDSNERYISDIDNPSYETPTSPMTLEEIPPNSGSVYESAYFYLENDDFTISHFYKGVNAVDTQDLTLDPSLTYLLDDLIDEADPILGYNDEQGSRWVIKNNSSDHEDWTFTHSNTPNVSPYVSFNEDHWWVYDFGENNPKVINRVDIFFSVETQFRHYLVEISGSNNPNIFSTDPYNTSNITGDHWVGLGLLIENENDINNEGISQKTLSNTTPYRWYKLTFKGGFFQEDTLSISEFKFYEISSFIQPEIRMSDFYGLHLIDTILKDPALFGFQQHDYSSYNSGFRLVTSSEVPTPIRLGGGPENTYFL